MRRIFFGALIAAAATLGMVDGAQAYQDGRGWGHPAMSYNSPSPWERDDWRMRMERREQRREFWRQRREAAEWRAYEAGRQEAYQGQRGQNWGYR